MSAILHDSIFPGYRLEYSLSFQAPYQTNNYLMQWFTSPFGIGLVLVVAIAVLIIIILLIVRNTRRMKRPR
jgi:hypothetical protein